MTRYAARMRLKIRRLDSTVSLPSYGTSEAAGFDLASAHDVVVQPRQIVLVRTGLVIQVPTGYFLAICEGVNSMDPSPKDPNPALNKDSVSSIGGPPTAIMGIQGLFYLLAATWLVIGIINLSRIASGVTSQSITMKIGAVVDWLLK